MTEPTLRVLIVEDSPDDAELLLRELSRGGFRVAHERVDSGDAMRAALDRGEWDLVISDHSLPAFDSTAALRLARERGLDVPFIIVSGTLGEKSAVEAMKAGAQDYLVKGSSLARLVPAVQRELREAETRRERARAETDLRESQRVLATLMANLPGAAYRCRDDDGRTIEFISEGCLELMGCPASAFAEDRSGLVELTHPQDRERVREEIRAAVHAGAVYRTIFRLRDVAGREKWVWEQGRAVHAADGSVAALEGFITDVTERKRAEEVLRNQQRWLERLLDLAPSPMLLVELGSGRVIFVNRAGEALTDGLRPMREVAGGEDPDFYYTEAEGRRVAPDELPAALAAQGERLEALQLDWHTPAGTRSLLVSSDVLPATAGHTATAILVLQDVTALKRIEAELRAAHRVKDEFLATLSHELRTPLSPILGWAGMMRSERLDPATRTRGVEAILRNATLQARLVDDLLDVSAIVSGKIRLHLQPVDLAEIVREATDAIRPAAMAKRIQLEVAPGPGDVRVSADPDRLRQVVSNLLSNAVKFTPTGGAVTAALDSAPGAIELVVRDTGEGISPEFLPHVFERFRQADSTTTRRYGGLGIGLALVRHLVEMHGGSVRAESEGPGRGSAFRVRLPALAPVLPAKRPAPDAAPPAETGEGLLAGVRVLAVEDDPDTLELLSAVLGRAGATVRCASSGAAALNDLEAWRPDLLVVDIGMPEMDGYRLLARVRDLERGAGGVIPALAVTAYTGDVSRERIMAAGFQDHLPKPLDPMELVRHAARLARRTGAGA